MALFAWHLVVSFRPRFLNAGSDHGRLFLRVRYRHDRGDALVARWRPNRHRPLLTAAQPVRKFPGIGEVLEGAEYHNSGAPLADPSPTAACRSRRRLHPLVPGRGRGHLEEAPPFAHGRRL